MTLADLDLSDEPIGEDDWHCIPEPFLGEAPPLEPPLDYVEADDLPAAVAAAVPLRIVPVKVFSETEEETAEVLVGDAHDAILTAGSTAIVYGDGGAGKTTLTIDAAAHWGAGRPWLGLTTCRPLRILLVENEGPREPFRRKVNRKRATWQGGSFDDNVFVLEEPWTHFTFALEQYRQELAELVQAEAIDIVVAGPLQELGMKGGGTPDDVSAFYSLIDDFRTRVEKPIALWLVHHENKGGGISGAWERVPDTLIHVRLEGHGRTAVHWRKTRWSSSLHDTTMKLRWLTDSEGFEIEDADAVAAQKAAELDDATAWIATYVNEHPGLARSKVETAYHAAHDGGRNRARTAIDRQLEALKEWERTGEHPPLLATTVGEARNGTYLIPFNHACSPLATTPNGEGGQQSHIPTETGAARRSPLAYKGEQEHGEQRDGQPE